MSETTTAARRGWRLMPLGLVLVLATSCVVERQYVEPTLHDDMAELMTEMAMLPPFPEPAPASGSLWTDGGPGAALARDARGFRRNDLVTVVVEESALGTTESLTELSRQSSADVGASVLFGLEDPNPTPGEFSLNQAVRASASTEFAGDGATTRSNLLSAFVTTRVLRVLPNGDLVIAGQKQVVVNREHQVLTLVGAVRTVDIDARNRVSSSAIGNLTVRLWGRGEVDDTTRQGWFMRMLNRFWPL